MGTNKNTIIDIDDKASPSVLSAILGINVSLLYQEAQKGRLPNPVNESSYKECVQAYVYHFKKTQDLKIEKERNEQKLKEAKLAADLEFKERKHRANLDARRNQLGTSEDGDLLDEGMPPLVAAKTKQEIRLAIAREQQLWIRASVERGDYISMVELIELCEPIIMTIRQGLLSLSLENDELQERVDNIMESLYKFGTVLAEQAEKDSKIFVKQVMERDINFSEIDIESLPEPVL